MEKVLKVIRELEQNRIIDSYALGGAFALLFYAEPMLTYDLDIFIFLPESGHKRGPLINLGPLYDHLRSKGYRADKEHVMIEGVPVQLIPAYNALVQETVKEAKERKYKETKTRVARVEHLLAIMLDTNRSKDRERISQLIEQVKIDKNLLRGILDRHGLKKNWESKFGRI